MGRVTCGGRQKGLRDVSESIRVSISRRSGGEFQSDTPEEIELSIAQVQFAVLPFRPLEPWHKRKRGSLLSAPRLSPFLPSGTIQRKANKWNGCQFIYFIRSFQRSK